MRNTCPYQQSFTKDLRTPWVESEEILKIVEKIIIGDIKCRESVQRGNIYDLVMGKNITGSIISSFLNVLKVNDIDIGAMCPLFFTSLLNKERVTDSINYVMNNPNLMKKKVLICSAQLKKCALESDDSYATN